MVIEETSSTINDLFNLKKKQGLTKTIDPYAYTESPYKLELVKNSTSITNSGWVKFSDRLSKVNGLQNDSILFYLPSIPTLQYKTLEKVEILLTIEYPEGTSYESLLPELNSIGLGVEDDINSIQYDTVSSIKSGEQIPKGTYTFNDDNNELLWGYTPEKLHSLLMNDELICEVNLNMMSATPRTLLGVTTIFYYHDQLLSEQQAVYNRLKGLGYEFDMNGYYTKDEVDKWLNEMLGNLTLTVTNPTGISGGGINYSILMKDVYGKPIHNSEVWIYGENNKYDTVITDDNGLATGTVILYDDIKIHAAAKFSQDYLLKSNEVSISIKKPKLLLLASRTIVNINESVDFDIKCYDQHGNILSGISVNLYNYTTVIGTGVSDSNGSLKLNYVPPDTELLRVKAKYVTDDGFETYESNELIIPCFEYNFEQDSNGDLYLVYNSAITMIPDIVVTDTGDFMVDLTTLNHTLELEDSGDLYIEFK